MLRLVLIASLLAGCRVSLEDEPPGGLCSVGSSAQCTAADTQQSLTWIEKNIFQTSCTASGCHNGDQSSTAGRLDLRPGMSHAHLVDIASTQDSGRKLVVPNDIQASYLLLMLQDYEPSMATPPGSRPSSGYMPLGSVEPLCCQKLEAIERWIMDGAPNN